MKHFFFFLSVSFFSLQAFSQMPLEIVKKNHVPLNKEFNLVMISHSNCGHCRIALKELQPIAERLGIIVVNFGDNEKIQEFEEKYPYIFLDAENLEGLRRQEFFPRFFLYKNDELVWKGKGWFDKSLPKIESKLKG